MESKRGGCGLTKNRRGQNKNFSLCSLKDRRGSHIGIILSFVIFVIFMVFLYVAVKPAVKTGEDKKAFLEILKADLLENVSDNLTSAGININAGKNPDNKNCVEFSNLITKLEIDEATKSQLVVKNETGNVLTFYVSGADLEITRTERANSFFKIYHSPSFDAESGDSTPNCKKIEDDEYTAGQITTEKYVFEKRIMQLKEDYETPGRYEKIKDEWKIPPGKEFGFNLLNRFSKETAEVAKMDGVPKFERKMLGATFNPIVTRKTDIAKPEVK